MGSATSKNGYLSLTPDPEDDPKAQLKVGRVLYRIPVTAWPAIITTIFTVNMAPFPHSNISGDGFSFIMVPDASPPPLNSVGGFLGIMNTTAQGVFVGQLAVEFDTFKNSFTNDISDNHVGIDTTSITRPIAARNLPIKLASGKDIRIRIVYHAKVRKLIVAMANEEFRPMQTVAIQELKLSETVPKFVYVGFTASTGLYSGTHRILNWGFKSTHAGPIDSLNDHTRNITYQK
ncbi:L-type lectin-domain containing receptor kinase S.7 [Tripterygium wilfordii]|uniref:L-type lectin-domain containing receptor kinase S.7 n=1 Tax=Tripterygium wilfordii TaxID=458696 RepID=A0A7J7CG36_TRIWF|nr:L-type lectin-domain containing receptor kinase S.7 [Tripterygium wilfordii]